MQWQMPEHCRDTYEQKESKLMNYDIKCLKSSTQLEYVFASGICHFSSRQTSGLDLC